MPRIDDSESKSTNWRRNGMIGVQNWAELWYMSGYFAFLMGDISDSQSGDWPFRSDGLRYLTFDVPMTSR
jgi:hypothetical protein